MPKGTFDAEGFYAALDSHRLSRSMTWKQVAAESGVSASTLTRMAQGRRPDVDSLAALVAWSGDSADDFMLCDDSMETRSAANPLANIAAQFRHDPRLPPEAKKAIETTLKVLYQQFVKDASE